MTWEIRQGHVLDRLREMPDESVHCCVTSPPYWGLRDYGVDDQMGLEETPEQFVAKMVEVFAEVRRVLRADGTLWLNIGDSYAGSWGAQSREHAGKHASNVSAISANQIKAAARKQSRTGAIPPGTDLKPKDLVGIPWALAQALRAPRYTGRIRSERDRVWLAATIDAEGSICGSTHVRKDDGRTRTSLFITITNSDTRMLDEAARIWPASRVDHNTHGDGHLGNRPTFRWLPQGAEEKSLLCREMLPYLVVKRKQALLGWRFCELSQEAKRLARSPQAKLATDQRAYIVDALSRLNHGEDIDIPSWVGEPPSLHEPGWYLRRDIIWNKPNPMPESVTDRPTSAHEYLFLLTKSSRYFYDAEAIREKATYAGPNGAQHSPHAQGFARRTPEQERERQDKQRGHGRRHDGFNDRWDAMSKEEQQALGRNKRSVWTIATKPFSGAHFATFPTDLVEPCIKAGTSPKVCAECGAPWRRSIEVTYENPGNRSTNGPRSIDRKHKEFGSAGYSQRLEKRVETTGYEPTCDHADDSGRAVVLDPFAGAATTLLVATQLGRDSIGIELNPEYVEIGEQRIRRWEHDPAGHLRRGKPVDEPPTLFDSLDTAHTPERAA